MKFEKLKHRIGVYYSAAYSDGLGGNFSSLYSAGNRFAFVEKIDTSRMFEQGKSYDKNQYKVTMRYQYDINITSNEVIYYGGKYLVMHEVLNYDEKNEMLTILCYERET